MLSTCLQTEVGACTFAGEYERHIALQMDRTARLAESRARILNAVRATYIDFMHDNYITGQQLFHLQVRDQG